MFLKKLKMSLYTLFEKLKSIDFQIRKVMHEIIAGSHHDTF